MVTATGENIPLTALDAVNLMLLAIGSDLVDSLLVTDTNADADGALKTLQLTSREVQSLGWHWNREYNYPLEPDATTGVVEIPLNTLTVSEVRSGKWTRELVERGGKLYDSYAHTFAIGETVMVDLMIALQFEELPSQARWYIAVKSVRRFAMDNLPSGSTFQYTKNDEQDALILLQQSEADAIRDTQKTVNSHVIRMRRR